MHTLDLDKLPDFAQNELQDFYQFLLQKYTTETRSNSEDQRPLAPRLVKPFVPLYRDEAYDR